MIETQDDLLALCDKQDEFARFCTDVLLIRTTLPQLEARLAPNAERIIAYHGQWHALLQVCSYVLANPCPGVYMRELPSPVHAKFVEQHPGILRRLLDVLLPATALATGETMFERRYGLRYHEPLVRLRFLDPDVQATCGVPVTDISAPVSQMAQLALKGRQCVIVEHTLTFLTLPQLPNTVAMWGGGCAGEALGELTWLHHCPLWYWGDLDAQGFQILARVRALFPHAVSVRMDQATLERFRTFMVMGTPCAAAALSRLTPDEHTLFAHVAHTQLRVEQEHIDHACARARLRDMVATANTNVRRGVKRVRLIVSYVCRHMLVPSVLCVHRPLWMCFNVQHNACRR